MCNHLYIYIIYIYFIFVIRSFHTGSSALYSLPHRSVPVLGGVGTMPKAETEQCPAVLRD